MSELGGELAQLIRDKNWAATPLGPSESWSPALKMMVGMVVANRFPMLLWWGPDYISIYNDAYRPVLGSKHPEALGLPFREVWGEVANVLGPLIDVPFQGGPSSWTEDILLEINRYGFAEETHFAFAYSPVPDETAPRGIGGVLATVSEITEKIVGERRLAVLRDLGARTGEARSAEEACALMATALRAHARDLPFALLYLIDEPAAEARLAGAVGAEPGTEAAPPAISLTDAGAWPLATVRAAPAPLVVEDLGRRFATVPQGPWPDPPGRALIVPIRSTDGHSLAGFLIVGISPRLSLDARYRSFLELAAAQIGTAIGHARAYEEEKRRAEALAEIDRAKTVFFSNVSHEFRTPLTLMLGPLEDALADAAERLGPQQRQRVALAERNGLRLQRLVNALLDFSRVEAGRLQATYQPTDLAGLTRDLASSFRSACERAGLALEIDTPPLPEPVFVDRGMWEKIVLNLISNAFKFTFEGSIRISLAAEDDAAVLRVADTGTGIPAEQLPLIFERFHRIDGARGRTHEGTGIGLALVRELVGQHQGSIAAESELGRGSLFTLRLPFGRTHLPQDRIDAGGRAAVPGSSAGAFVGEALRWLPDEAAGEAPEAPLLPLDGGPKPVVLVVDDNADMRAYLSQLLGLRYEIRLAEHGAAALSALRRERPALVLSDIMMPVLDGYGLLRAIRAEPGLHDLPVVLLSARAGEEETIEGLDAGADDYLVKPFSARELSARIAACLERSEGRQALRDSEARFRALVTATADVVYRMSPDWREMRTLEGRGFLSDTEQPTIAWIDEYLLPEDRAEILEHIQAAIDTKTAFKLEHRVRRADGTIGWTFSRAVPLLDGEGRIVEWFGAATDVTERRKVEQHLQLIANELNHRVKNNLAMVQSIAAQTFRGAESLAQAEAKFAGRLMAVAQANDLMIGERGVAVALEGVLRQALQPHVPDPPRCRIDGPAIELTSKTGLAFSMAMHELATNALKYGAWSGPDGIVEIGWQRGPDRLRLHWRESGGPPVAPPARRGFGSRLIERGLAAELGGQVQMRFEPSGLVCEIDAPISLYDGEETS